MAMAVHVREWTTAASDREQRYVGRDRRGVIVRSVSGRSVAALVVGASVLTWLAFGLFEIVSGEWEATTSPEAVQTVATLSACAAFVTLVLTIARWRLVGDALAFAIALVALFSGLMSRGVGDVLPFLVPVYSGDAVLAPLGAAGTVLSLGVAGGGLWLQEVDGRLNVPRVLTSATLIFLATAAALASAPGLTAALARPETAVLDGRAPVVGSALVAVAWFALAAGYVRDAARRGSDLSLWFVALLVCFGQARVALILSADGGSTWLLAAHVFGAIAFFLIFAGTVDAAKDAFRRESSRLLDTVVESKTAAARYEAERRERAEREHDLRSALHAIDGAALTLERHFDGLAPGDRATLARSLSSEIARIQRLVAGETDERHCDFDVGATVESLVAVERAGGREIGCDIETGCVATGDREATAEIVRNLLDNAAVHAPGSAVDIAVRRSGDAVVVHVGDRGPGVAPEERRRIFDRGWRAARSASLPGSGLGLFIASRLASDQGGRIWVEERAGGGARFVLTLAAAGTVREETGTSL